MWIVRLARRGPAWFSVVVDRTREAAEQKAAEQIKAWDAEFSRLWQGVEAAADAAGQGSEAYRKALKRIPDPENERGEVAKQLTAQVQEELAALGSLLRSGMLMEISSTRPQDCSSPYPVPPPSPYCPEPTPLEPVCESFLPHLGFTAGLIPPLRKRAEERFSAAHTDWERLKLDIETRNREGTEKYERDLADWEVQRRGWLDDQARRNAAIDQQLAAYSRCEPEFVAAYCRLLLNASPYPGIAASKPEIALQNPGEKHPAENPEELLFTLDLTASEYPDTFPQTLELDYIGEPRTVVVDYSLPPKEALPSVKGYRYVKARDEIQPVLVSQAWLNETYDSVLYQVTLRTIYELFRWDEAGALDSVVFNGWVNSIDKATGKEVNACVLTIQASKKEFFEINLAQVDPKACFRKLKGISAAKLIGMSPVRPILRINRADKRFITARPVVDVIDSSTNLAGMDWEDFEQLIRDVFEKEFSKGGGEVKITRASRDHGVDAVAFDPDPIRGGKIVIQAKRYTDTVSVSAVRDLYGTILNEGANKGILVTTADYGADAYEFAKGKPITLLNGSELLFLLQKHGHRARIDLAEARMLAGDRAKQKPTGSG